MGGASSKGKSKVPLHGSSKHFNGKLLATTNHHEHYWLSQSHANLAAATKNAGARGSSRSQFYLNEHDSGTFAAQAYEPLHLASLATTATASTPPPPPPPPPPLQAPTTTAQHHNLHHLDYSDFYQTSVPLGQPGQHVPIFEDADLYLEHGHDPASIYGSHLHLNYNTTHSQQQQQQQQQHSRARKTQLTAIENPFGALKAAHQFNATSIYNSNHNNYNSNQANNINSNYCRAPPPRHPLDSCSLQSGPQSTSLDGQVPGSRRLPAGRRRKVVVAQHKRAQFERGLAMADEDRRRTSQLGLLPAAVQDQELQSRAVLNFLANCQDELAKYMYLRNLKDFNESLFYYTLTNNVEKLMPLVYTPTVGLACQKFSEIYMRPRGLFVTAKDLGRVRQVVANWPERDVRVIVVTDGERILGLGDLGANGMGISIGKLSLYTALAGIPPQNVLPVTIDVGTNNEFNLKDPFYIGLRQKRVRGELYDQLVEEFMQAVVERWGRSCLIQFEDFANTNAFTLLNRYRDHFCTFNDDIQGTASVSLSGLLTAARLCGRRLGDCTFLFYGAGEANLGTANLLVMAMQDDGLTRDEAKRRIFLVDSKGLVVKSRAELTGHKLEFAQEAQHLVALEEIVDFVRPTALIGASAQGGSFSEPICKKMAEFNERPIIFALSNPTSKAECTAAQAYEWTGAKCVFASGSPFEPVTLNGRTYVTGQGNNAYIFPGVGLAAIAAHTHTIPEQTFLVAARALSDQVTGGDIEVGLVYPSLAKIREVTLRVATRCLEYFYAERLANYCPEPMNKEEFLRSLQYDPKY